MSEDMDRNKEFWQYLDRLAAEKPVVIDRPGGSSHPRYPDMIYPLDYGFLEGTQAIDGGGIDVWRGAFWEEGANRVSSILCSVDLIKGDAEVKILLGCSPQETEMILEFMNGNSMRAIYIQRGP